MTDAFTLHHGDCLDILRDMPDASVDAVVTDPPYGLSFMGKRWDYDVPSVAVWSECLRVLKPGGHLLSFGGSRTYHRMAVNVEDAGFEIRDQVMWVYGSGFPKSHNISKAIDKAAGVEFKASPASGVGFMNHDGAGGYNVTKNQLCRSGDSTPAAQQWDGWGSALKPAHEPIVLARKPLAEKTLAANVLEHGTGAINVDGCRVGDENMSGQFEREWNKQGSEFGFGNGLRASKGKKVPDGRFPANLIHDGSDEVVELFPGAGEKSAARFFYCAKASKADRDEGLDGFSAQKTTFASGTGLSKNGDGTLRNQDNASRNIHPTVKPTDLMAYLCRLVTPPGGVVLDPFVGSGSTGKAAIREGFKFIGMEREAEYIAIARARIEAANV